MDLAGHRQTCLICDRFCLMSSWVWYDAWCLEEKVRTQLLCSGSGAHTLHKSILISHTRDLPDPRFNCLQKFEWKQTRWEKHRSTASLLSTTSFLHLYLLHTWPNPLHGAHYRCLVFVSCLVRVQICQESMGTCNSLIDICSHIQQAVPPQRVSFMPGFRPMFSPLSPFGAIFPNNRANPGSSWSWSSTTCNQLQSRRVPTCSCALLQRTWTTLVMLYQWSPSFREPRAIIQTLWTWWSRSSETKASWTLSNHKTWLSHGNVPWDSTTIKSSQVGSIS